MLDSHSKRVLKAVKKLYQIKKDTIVGSSSELLKFLPKKYDENLVNGALWYLETQGMVQCENADDTIYSIVITYKGLCYATFRVKEVNNYIITSVLVPIGVSIITTIIIHWLILTIFP
jgi:hypothetical protein